MNESEGGTRCPKIVLIKESLENKKSLNLFSNPNIKDPAEHLVTKNERNANRKKENKNKNKMLQFSQGVARTRLEMNLSEGEYRLSSLEKVSEARLKMFCTFTEQEN